MKKLIVLIACLMIIPTIANSSNHGNNITHCLVTVPPYAKNQTCEICEYGCELYVDYGTDEQSCTQEVQCFIDKNGKEFWYTWGWIECIHLEIDVLNSGKLGKQINNPFKGNK